ncbi:MAG: ThiF family adenylyltransferase [Thermodesulfobacteriota bacterium]
MDKSETDIISQLSENGFVSIKSAGKIAQELNLSLRETENLILSNGFIPLKYKKNSFTSDDQKRLFNSKILIAGCGATGQVFAQSYARLGIGSIIFFDPDSFEDTNLNRQFFSNESNLNASKAAETSKELKNINSSVNIKFYETRIESDDFVNCLENADLAVDALDNFKSRLYLEKICRKKEKKFIHTAISGWCGQAKIVYPGEDFLLKTFGDKTDNSQEESNNLFAAVMTLSGIVTSLTLKILLNKEQDSGRNFIFFDLEHFDFISEQD